MKKGVLNAQVLVAVISLSLAGIIGLQAYLFRSAIMVRDARFKAEAAEALERVSARLEALETSKIISGELAPQYEFGNAFIFSDSAMMVNQNGIELSSHIDTVFINPEDLTMQGFEMRMDTTGMGAQVNQQIIIRAAAEKERYRQFVEQRIRRMDTLMRQMLLQGISSTIPLEGKFTKQEIDSVLYTELAQKGLVLNFEYGVIDNGFLGALRTENFDPNVADFKVPLYKNDFFSGPKWLLISFPERVSYLLKSLWYMLALSGLFTATIIIAFGYTLNQMQKQKKISQIKSDFINNMTHEFKTPIATISLAVDALSNPKVQADLPRIEHYRKVIREENKRMHAQVEKVLQLALLDKQELELRKKTIDMHELIRSSANHMALRVEEKGGQLNLEFEAAHANVLGDELHLGNVIVNLLDNALKYAESKPEIKVKTQVALGTLQIAVSDNGIGMSKDVQRKIFERFYRQEGGNIHNVKGHGLGLSYVREIIEMHGGLITVDSQLGEGSIFTIELSLTSINYEQSTIS
jgi:signal transduction histidine kinase